jgi:hypothetical protein
MDSWGVFIRTWNWRLGFSVRGPYPRLQILGGKQSVNGISKLLFGSQGVFFFWEFCVIAEVAMTHRKI